MKIVLFFLGFLTLNYVKGQIVFPSNYEQYCPNTVYTFTVTALPKPYKSITALNNAILIQAPPPGGYSIFFSGMFLDFNSTQKFRITYNDNTFYDLEFNRIKSLFFSTSCSKVPNQAPITVPRCKILDIPISIPNVTWGNSLGLCFGSIDQFEYKLPTDWSLGGVTSTGNNWISGGKNVIVTSDNSNGVEGSILVRPKASSCASGLANNQVEGVIPINRPKPILSIPETDTEICTGSKTYTISGLPQGATTSWSITNNYGVASLSNATNTSVQIDKINTGNGHETLTATVSHCTFTYKESKVISLGVPTALFDIFTYVPLNSDCFETDAFYIFRPSLKDNYDIYPPSYHWSYRISGNANENSVLSTGEDGVFLFDTQGLYDIIVRPVNSCGIGLDSSIKTIYVQTSPACGSMLFSMLVSPNPADDYINVEITESLEKLNKTNEIVKFKLYDFNSLKAVKEWDMKGLLKQYKLDILGIKAGKYVLSARAGKRHSSKQLIIK